MNSIMMQTFKKQTRCFRYISGLVVLLLFAMVPVAHAAQSTSTNYGVNEVFFGTGGELNACSAAYCSKQAAGETSATKTTSTTYGSQTGFNTERQPSLTLVVNTSSINLGTLTPGTPATATATFNVKSYLSSGYIVQTSGAAPTNSTYTLTTLASPTASNPAVEQFGINLVANTSPSSFGANPSQVPSGSFSFGAAAANYNTTNLYKYVNGDTIAQSTSSSGETDYTISYLVNTTALSRGGTYTMRQVLVATATF